MDLTGSSVPKPWREAEVFHGLRPEQFAHLEPLVRRRSYEPGEVVIREREEGREMYIVERGEVEVYKEEGGFVVARLHAGADFGLMALLDGAPRSASVRTATPATLASLALDDLNRLDDTERLEISDTILRNHTRKQAQHLRDTTDLTVEALRRELEEAKARAALGSFVTHILVIMCAYAFVLRDAIIHLSSMEFSTLFTVGILVVYAAVVVLMMRRSGYPLRIYGLTMERWPAKAAEAVVWTVGFCAAATLGKAVLLATTDAYDGPLFAWPMLHTTTPGRVVVDALLYGVFSPVQELVARGALQGSLQQFLTGPYVKLRAILFSTLIFTATHLHLSVGFALLVVIPSLFWGALFARQRSLFGVSLSHILVGWYILYILGFPGLQL